MDILPFPDRFDECPLSPLTLRGVKAAGYERMTAVQEATLPIILQGSFQYCLIYVWHLWIYFMILILFSKYIKFTQRDIVARTFLICNFSPSWVSDLFTYLFHFSRIPALNCISYPCSLHFFLAPVSLPQLAWD